MTINHTIDDKNMLDALIRALQVRRSLLLEYPQEAKKDLEYVEMWLHYLTIANQVHIA